MTIEIRSKDIDGKRLYMVPVTPRGIALIWQDDLKQLISLGVSLRWQLQKSKTVRVSGRNSANHLQVSRLITDAGPGEIVRALNGDPLDLRRENLVKLRGQGKRRDREYILPKTKQRRPLTPEQLIEELGL